jgi:alpha-glucosidase (family GH31 glycosyl hydrolase)
LPPKERSVDLKVPITITDELSEEVITATALLNLASGEIHRVEYVDHDTDELGFPWESEDYEFTSGTLSNNGKDVEFSVQVNRTTGQYAVSANELLEIKVKAAALFAGVSGRDLAAKTAVPGAGGERGKPSTER